jgi:putative methyltransferase (TIGR04325 family)
MNRSALSELAQLLLMRSLLGKVIGRLPLLRGFYGRLVWRKRMNQFFGAFGSFGEASAAAGRITSVGWNEPGIAGTLIPDTPFNPSSPNTNGLFQPCHYAAMFWIAKRIKPGSQITDLGGAGGISYELYTRHSALPPNARWQVVDLPELIERGKRRHANTADGVLTFCSCLEGVSKCDILLTSGCIQYLEDPFGFLGGKSVLDQIVAPPQHIIVNKIPLTNGKPYVTIQNLLNSASPYHVFNRDEVLAYFRKWGYRLADEWRVPELAIGIPFHAELYVPELSGFYWSREQV